MENDIFIKAIKETVEEYVKDNVSIDKGHVFKDNNGKIRYLGGE